MAMSVITSYVIFMRAPSGIRYVVQKNFRLGLIKPKEIGINHRKIMLEFYRNTFVAQINANVEKSFFHRYMRLDVVSVISFHHKWKRKGVYELNKIQHLTKLYRLHRIETREKGILTDIEM